MKIICPLFALFNCSAINCVLFTLVVKASLSWADDTSPVCMNPNGLYPTDKVRNNLFEPCSFQKYFQILQSQELSSYTQYDNSLFFFLTVAFLEAFFGDVFFFGLDGLSPEISKVILGFL